MIATNIGVDRSVAAVGNVDGTIEADGASDTKSRADRCCGGTLLIDDTSERKHVTGTRQRGLCQ